MEKLQQSIMVLSALKNSLETSLKVFKRYMKDEDVKYILHQQLLLNVCSFKEEWSILNSLVKEDEKIKQTLSICSCALKRINKWKDIRNMRNTMIAHGFRDEKNGKLPTNLKKRYFEADVPNTYCEILLLAELSSICCGVFIARHGAVDPQDYVYTGEIETKGIETTGEFDEFISINNAHMFAIDPSLKGIFINYRTLTDVVNNR